MGLSATICGGSQGDDPIDPSDDDEPAEPPERDDDSGNDSEFVGVTTSRRQRIIAKRLQNVLAGPLCVPQASYEASEVYPKTRLLGSALCKSILDMRDPRQRLRALAFLDGIVAEMTRVPATLLAKFSRVKPVQADNGDYIEELKRYVVEDNSEPGVLDAVDKYAVLLTQCFDKACVELEFAVQASDNFVTLHHAALVGDILREVHHLIHRPEFGPTEENLPPQHSGAKAYQTQN